MSIVPLLNFDDGVTIFQAGSTALNPNITFTRASSAQDFNDPSLTFGTNVPVLTPSGWLLQGARTNFVRNSEAQGGGVGVLPTNWFVNTSGGLTVTSVGNFVVNGLNVHRIQLSGTTTSTSASIRFETTTSTVAASGQTWTGSLYTRQFSGSQTNITSIDSEIQERDAAGAFLTSSAAGFAVGTLLVRGSHTRLLNNASTARITNSIRLNFSGVGVTVDITLDVAAPQLELGSFASSYIPTTGTTATRAADVATISNLASIGFSATEGTFLAEFSLIGLDAATALRVLRVDDGTGNNFIGLSKGGGSTNLIGSLVVSGVATNTAALVALSANTTFRAAEAYNSSGVAGVANGGTVQTAGTSSPSGLTTLRLGSGVSGENLFGYLRRIVYYPTRLPNATLQALTA